MGMAPVEITGCALWQGRRNCSETGVTRGPQAPVQVRLWEVVERSRKGSFIRRDCVCPQELNHDLVRTKPPVRTSPHGVCRQPQGLGPVSLARRPPCL